MSALLTRNAAAEAITVLSSLIETLMGQGFLKRPALHIVILNPGASYTPGTPAGTLLDEDVLHEHSFDSACIWEKPYNIFARAKAALTLRTGMNTRRVLTCYPHLLLPGDIKYPGGVIVEGLIVGVSGVQSEYDEMIARWIAATCIAIAHRGARTALDDADANGGPYMMDPTTAGPIDGDPDDGVS